MSVSSDSQELLTQGYLGNLTTLPELQFRLRYTNPQHVWQVGTVGIVYSLL